MTSTYLIVANCGLKTKSSAFFFRGALDSAVSFSLFYIYVFARNLLCTNARHKLSGSERQICTRIDKERRAGKFNKIIK